MLSQDKYRIALLSAYAVGLHGLESLLPSPVPWLKFGLANIITLITLMLYGFRPAIMVTLIRVLISSLFTGTFPGPAFLLSLGAGLSVPWQWQQLYLRFGDCSVRSDSVSSAHSSII